MPRMLILCPYPEGVAPGQRLKYEPYVEDWRARGWEVDVAPFADPALWRILFEPGQAARKALGVLRGHGRRMRDLTRVGRYDLVYVHMNVTPLGTTWSERLVRARARRLIFDVEDNVIDAADGVAANAPNPLVRHLKGPNKALYLIRTADLVITASPLLNALYRPLARDPEACVPITSSVDTDRLRPAPARAAEPDAPVVLGWTGTFSTKVYLDRLAPVLRAVAARRRVRLRVVGNFDHALDGIEVDSVRWSPEREAEDLQAMDVGLYPLAHDRWTVGKSGIKAIQYMATGLPTVASDVSTTPDVLDHGRTGLLVPDDDDAWIAALLRLIDDPALRRRMGEAARADAVARFSRRAVRGLYRDAIDRVMAR